MTVNAHFDGKVIVPDEPLDLPPNQVLILQIQPVSGQGEHVDESVLSWLAANAVDSEALPAGLGRPPRPLPLRPFVRGRATVVAAYFADTSFWIALSSRLLKKARTGLEAYPTAPANC